MFFFLEKYEKIHRSRHFFQRENTDILFFHEHVHVCFCGEIRKILCIFLISPQKNAGCGYLLEAPR